MSEAELGPGADAGPEAGPGTAADEAVLEAGTAAAGVGLQAGSAAAGVGLQTRSAAAGVGSEGEQSPGTSAGSEAELGTVPAGVGPEQADVGPERASGGAVRLVLWRHGQTRWNAERRFQGQSDVPLDAKGHRQAQRAARLLAALRPQAIYSSDLCRAVGTADWLAELTGVAVRLDKDLRERHGGSWEGLTDVEIRTRYPAAYAAWVPPDGEPVAAVAERAAEAFERVADSLAAGSLAVVVSHGAAINLGISRLLGLPEKARVLGALDNCAWSVLGRRAGRWRLLEHNVGTWLDPVAERPRVGGSKPRGGAGN
jgi:glucosyl-3-phosphoglycerate phosphatase